VYAVIRSGGKQYRVEPGQTIQVERLPGKVGVKVTFDQVLAVHTDEELLTGAAAAKAKVNGKIVEQGRRRKVLVMKYKKTNQYRIRRGHRQDYSAVEISQIKIS